VAPDHEPLAALLAVTTADDVIGDDPVTRRKAAHARPDGLDPARRLVARDHVLVALVGVRASVLVVDGAQVAAAEARGFHFDEHLAGTRLRAVKLLDLHPRLAR